VSQSTRLRDIIAILETRHHPVPINTFLEELGVSLSSFKRDIGILRDQMNAAMFWKTRGGDPANSGCRAPGLPIPKFTPC
jgi:hypothetical protein